MRKKSNLSLQRLTRLGGPEAGTVAALAIGRNSESTVFVGTPVGLYRSVGYDGKTIQSWARLTTAPIGLLALAVSPEYASDHTLVAGTTTGLFISRDAGATWSAAHLPIAGSAVIALGFSPNYTHDGLLLAGTLEDGILYSNTRGASWQSRSFGLLDATVYAIAFSPNFAADQTAYAGTDTALYYSYNGALAWKQLPLPEDAAPALSLALSPHFENDRTLYVGTETEGLYQSVDGGETWRRLALPATCINAVLISQDYQALIVATEAGLFQSTNHGETWQDIFDLENVISLVAAEGSVVAGLVDQGTWLTTNLTDWQPLPNLSTRSLVGLALSPQFDREAIAFMFGPREGVWKTDDGGHTWNSLNDNLPTTDVLALALSPNFSTDRTLAAASPAGVLLSTDAGQHWKSVAAVPATLVAFSPNGQVLAANFPNGGIQVTEDLGGKWQRVPGPWEVGGRVIALSVSNAQHYLIALLEGVGETVSLWQGTPGQFEKALRQPVGSNPVVSFLVPSEPAPDRPWYASLGNQVWKFSSRKGRSPVPATVFSKDDQTEVILALAEAGPALLAHTGRHVFKSSDAQTWTKVYDFGNEPVVALALSPTYLNDKQVYVLLLGGYFCQGVIR